MVSGQALGIWYDSAKAGAIAENIPTAEVDWLLQAVTDLDRLALRLGTFRARSRVEVRLPLVELEQLWQKRLRDRVPLQYLIGTTPWRNFELKVSPAVLIPRPETEGIIEVTVAAAQGMGGDWVDLGTGSGAIAIGLADAFPEATIHAVDNSPEALGIAQENARNLGFAQRIEFHQGSWWEPLAPLKGTIRGMVSNPPYIPSSLITQLQPEVRIHEPLLALDGGDDGLDCLRYLVQTAPDYLRPGGIWLVEMMAGQASVITKLLRESGNYDRIQILPDLEGMERFALAYRLGN
ncbi:peptide chain release factor N(5)-glutamine methyltransferase [Lusitaniella coriacea LEGE 07157]|uniref:Release factor glutamine methyltransferase n=1 Tax=Lusitaniella coriacea LEGE 07157 TaxID=945747 RepID=A0A8J7DZR4_9CYAN|nr:peptide chain release factor N(5)-glutamine methyltransferase [Lusitaniella coriacea]MBE9117528.1 peptide chain release factor N(5)-glutamine methyltransferase [Lusitaniella coriacea LEGE 07157]